MLFINKAYAQATESLAELEGQIPQLPEAPTASELILQNLMVIGVLVFLFYILLILPQQKRFKEHKKMLDSLNTGDEVITGGGLVGKVEKVIEGSDEIVINLGEVKVTALRSTIHQKHDPRLKDKPAPLSEDKKAAKK
jgi:preprotein translocase subunit YajC